MFAGDGADLPDRLHCFIRGGRALEEYRHHRAVVGVEGLVDLVGQEFLRHGDIHHTVVPQNGVDLIDLPDLFLQGRNIFIGHILHDNKRKRAFAELVHQDILTFDGVHILGQVSQHIVVDTRVEHSKKRRNHQHKGNDHDRHPQLDDQSG